VKALIGFCCLSVFFAACGTLDVYEKSVFFPSHEWKAADTASFSFRVEDTAARYMISVIIRHEDAYHFNNIWLNIGTRAPGDSAKVQLVNITLADNKKGWLGTGMDDVFDHRVRITRYPVALRKGNYTFTLQQQMREEPLQYILNAGIRVEKVKP
jgi:gliding motility-associated lipoprotein GldH